MYKVIMKLAIFLGPQCPHSTLYTIN